MRWLLFVLLLLLSCKARNVPAPRPILSALGSAGVPVTLPAPVVLAPLIAPIPAASTAVPQPELPTGDVNAPPSAWAVSFGLASSMSRMSYSWEVGPGNAGAMHSAHWLDPKHPTSREVRFRASNATLRALKAKLIKDDCCAAFRASTCRAFDAPPATIAFSMGDLQCAARATPECTEERAARRCFDHLEGFLRAACGARCK